MFQIPQGTTFKLPFYCQTGANDRTPVAGFTPATTLVYVKKLEQGIAAAAGNGGVAESNQGIGLGTVVLSAADTDTPGPLVVVIDASASSGFVHLIECQVMPSPLATSFKILGGTAGVVLVSALPASADDDHWKDSVLRMSSGALAGQVKRVIASHEGIPLQLTGASYDDTGNVAGEHLLFLPGAFADYVWQAGDQIDIYSGAGITPGIRPIASRLSDDAILLSESAGSDSAGDVLWRSVTRVTLSGGFTRAPAEGDIGVLIAE